MSIAASHTARARRTLWGRVSLALLAGALLALIYLAARVVLAFTRGEFANLASASVWTIAVAAVLYLAGHAFRILRLALLIGGWRVGLRSIAAFHLMTAAVGLTAPLKLGELYRIVELSHLVGGFVRGVMIAWWERVFDVAVILCILALAFANTDPAAHAPFYAVALVAGAFVIGTAIAFFVAPDNLRRLSILIIRRYDSPRSVPLLGAINAARQAIQEAPWVVRNKIASLLTLTALIWVCEITCFAILLPAFAGSVTAALEGMLGFLSAITQGETLIGALDGGARALGADTLRYLSATQAPLALIGLGAGMVYATLRFKRSRA